MLTLSLFALAVDTNGDVMTMFIRHLIRQLDQEDPGWMARTIILLDNASWHTSPEMMNRLAKMQLPTIFSRPYSYSSAPIELVFAALKLGDLNPQLLPTGKKSLSHIADMVATRLAAIPRHVATSYWHHVVPNLYGYLYFKRL